MIGWDGCVVDGTDGVWVLEGAAAGAGGRFRLAEMRHC